MEAAETDQATYETDKRREHSGKCYTVLTTGFTKQIKQLYGNVLTLWRKLQEQSYVPS